MTLEELKKGEHVTVEYKLDIPKEKEKYLKTAVAFANGGGGKLIFGVKNQTWDVVGFPDDEVFQKYDAIANSIYDACTPPIVPMMEIEEIDGKKIIVADITRGMNKPYYLRADGMMEGTYIRVAGVTRKAEPYTIKELQLEGTSRSFDSMQVAGEEVSPDEIEPLCERMYQHALNLCLSDAQRHRQKKVTVNQLEQWRILVRFRDKYYPTYAWKLLTGDIDELFPYAFIQMALFKGETRDKFIDRKEAKGPIDEQIEDAMIFVEKHANLGARIEGVYRQDVYELPMDSVRELISNAVCHRSYLTPASIQVAIYDDRLEVTSPGRLSPELTIERLMQGNSRVRNVAIGAAFQYMHIIESWGSGIPRVFKETRLFGLGEPKIEDFGTSFRVSISRKPLEMDEYGVVVPRKAAENEAEKLDTASDEAESEAEKLDAASDEAESEAEKLDAASDEAESEAEKPDTASGEAESLNSVLSGSYKEALDFLLVSLPGKSRDRASRILVCMIRNPHSTATQIGKEIGCSRATVQRTIDVMKENGVVSREGSQRDGKWVIHWREQRS